MKTMTILIICLLILTGCSFSPNGEPVASEAPSLEDAFNYQTTLTASNGQVIPTDFSLLEGPVSVDYFCAGCVADYYLTFWYVPLQVDRFIGDPLEGDVNTDFAILRKPLYRNDNLEVSYLDSVYSIDVTDRAGNIIASDYNLEAIEYDPATYELIITGFPTDSQTTFAVTYFHSLPGRFKVYYEPTCSNPARGYVCDPRAEDWVTIYEPVQIVPPFYVRHVPVNLHMPSDLDIPSGYKYDFFITVAEEAASAGVESIRAYQHRWMITCR